MSEFNHRRFLAGTTIAIKYGLATAGACGRLANLLLIPDAKVPHGTRKYPARVAQAIHRAAEASNTSEYQVAEWLASTAANDLRRRMRSVQTAKPTSRAQEVDLFSECVERLLLSQPADTEAARTRGEELWALCPVTSRVQ